MEFIKGRIKELTSLHGGVLIGLGVVVLFFSPIAHIAAWAAIAYGAWAILKKDQYNVWAIENGNGNHNDCWYSGSRNVCYETTF